MDEKYVGIRMYMNARKINGKSYWACWQRNKCTMSDADIWRTFHSKKPHFNRDFSIIFDRLNISNWFLLLNICMYERQHSIHNEWILYSVANEYIYSFRPWDFLTLCIHTHIQSTTKIWRINNRLSYLDPSNNNNKSDEMKSD